jgi:hypothetical protein
VMFEATAGSCVGAEQEDVNQRPSTALAGWAGALASQPSPRQRDARSQFQVHMTVAQSPLTHLRSFMTEKIAKNIEFVSRSGERTTRQLTALSCFCTSDNFLSASALFTLCSAKPMSKAD